MWELVKGAAARQYKKGITFKEVRENLEKQFNNLLTEEGGTKIGKIIDLVDETISKLLCQIEREEEDDSISQATLVSKEFRDLFEYDWLDGDSEAQSNGEQTASDSE